LLSEDGNLYVAGIKPDSAVILKINPNGEILWARSFDFFPGYDDITHLSLDSDGMLLGCVVSCTCLVGIQNSCFFKYNPQTNQMLWIQRPGFYTAYAGYLYGIYEKYPNGNYYLEFSSAFPPFEDVLIEIHRQTGQEMIGTSWRYNWEGGSTHFFRFSTLHDSLIIINVDGSANIGFQRQGLICVSASDGQPKWWQMSHLPLTDSARIAAGDFVIDNDTIVSISSGNDEGLEPSKGFVFLQKTTSNGDVLWVKKYDLLEFPAEKATEIVRVSDGYVVFGGSEVSSFDNLFILKTDFDGNVLWARRYDYSMNDRVMPRERQNEFLEIDGFFYFIAYSRDSSGATDWVLAKLDSEGLVSDSCAYLTPTPVETYSILNPVQEQPPLSFRNLDIEFCSPVPIKSTSAADVSRYRTICENICTPEEGCDVKINNCVKFELLSIALDADGNRHYRVRFTNACAGQTLNYVAIQLPDGTVAVEPNDGAIVSTETGGDYVVRNPNYSPFYSVRFGRRGPASAPARRKCSSMCCRRRRNRPTSTCWRVSSRDNPTKRI
jgi:outer membrane protein assembly factor BamB